MSQFYVTPNLLAAKGLACNSAIGELMHIFGLTDREQRIYLTLENVKTLVNCNCAGRLEWLAGRMADPYLDLDYPTISWRERQARERLHSAVLHEAYRMSGPPRAKVLYDNLTKLAKRHQTYREKHA